MNEKFISDKKQHIMKKERSNCLIANSLDVFGDKWTLLILRDVALHGKTTFKELSQMEEGIASNTLSTRLEKMVKMDILNKQQSTRNKLVYHYRITKKGLDLVPVLQQIIQWAEKHLIPEYQKLSFNG